jgi:hypothetical protein
MKKIITVLLLTLALLSCESKSGQRHRAGTVPISTLSNPNRVKVVIKATVNSPYASKHRYRVKVLNDSTTAYIHSEYVFLVGDTVWSTSVNY